MHITHFVANDPTPSFGRGLQTAYHEIGSGEALVFVHGFTGSKLDFHDQLHWFSERHRVIAYDQRGHGESSNIGPYDLYSLAADLLGFLDALDIERCHILGHSLGGMVVLRALLADPKRFKSAILMDTAAHAVDLFPHEVRLRLNHMVQTQGCEGLLQGMQGQPQNPAVQRGIAFLGEQEHWRRIRVKLEQMDAQAFVELSGVLSEQPSVLESLKAVSVPTTVMVGELDKPFLGPSRAMAKALPNATLVTIPHAGHSPQYENTEAWQFALETHLDSVS